MYAIVTTAKMLIKNRIYAFEHLDGINEIIETCTDPRYVNLDMDSLKGDFRSSYIMRRGTMLIFIYIA